jgi:carbon-monoxide dehydrogenase medium subunit
MYPSRFRYEAPRSLDEAISTLRDGGDYAKVLAGGQSLVPLMKLRFASPELVVDINNVPGLSYHRAEPRRHLAHRRAVPARRAGALRPAEEPRSRPWPRPPR